MRRTALCIVLACGLVSVLCWVKIAECAPDEADVAKTLLRGVQQREALITSLRGTAVHAWYLSPAEQQESMGEGRRQQDSRQGPRAKPSRGQNAV